LHLVHGANETVHLVYSLAYGCQRQIFANYSWCCVLCLNQSLNKKLER
jgi:hypothetical protein